LSSGCNRGKRVSITAKYWTDFPRYERGQESGTLKARSKNHTGKTYLEKNGYSSKLQKGVSDRGTPGDLCRKLVRGSDTLLRRSQTSSAGGEILFGGGRRGEKNGESLEKKIL